MSAPRALYEGRLELYTAELAELDRRDRSLSWVRLALFVLLLLFLATAFWILPAHSTLFIILAAFSAVGFLWLVWIHQGVSARQRTTRELVRTNRESLARIDRRWDELPPAEIPDAAPRSTMSRDLLLFGHGSLLQLLGPPGTHAGRRILASWLLQAAPPETVHARQAAVGRLAPLLELRQELHIRATAAGRLDPREFLAWAEGQPWLAERPWLVSLSRLLPALFVASVVAQLTGATELPLWGTVLFVNFIVSLGFGERMHSVFDRVAARHGSLAAYERPFALVNSIESHDGLLCDIQGRLESSGGRAERAMRRLSRLVGLASLHHSQMTYLPIQVLTLWDFHVLLALERWQIKSGRLARQWLEALGEAEALSALAGLAHDNPDWAMPAIDSRAGDCLEARGLGHPLIADDVRVANDVTVGPEGTFLLVTGSNMSGKSTLLRAIGTNVVLAQAGSVVCATMLRMPPLQLATSIVIEDSLIDGISFFMAELRRLKEIVEAADELRGRDDRRLLYLLDEVLRGTNAIERQIAARRVIQHLLRSGAIGAISTHDTALAELPDLAAASRPVHFRETINAPGADRAMTFDYLLRPGLASTTNALKLLELVGLGGNEENGGMGG